MARERLTVCNTTPLINLAEIGRLDLLDKLFGQVVITPVVREELLAKESLFAAAAEAVRSDRFEVMNPGDRLLVRGFAATVHAGEAECLALAMEHPGSLLVLDDLAARSLAEAGGLPFTGTLGCLVVAKKRGWIDSVAPLLEDLRRNARFWISRQLEEAVLRDCGER